MVREPSSNHFNLYTAVVAILVMAQSRISSLPETRSTLVRGGVNELSQVKRGYQVAVTLLANWGMLCTGLVVAFPSAIVPPLLGPGPGIHASVDEASWVASLPIIPGILASLITGQLVDRFGRRRGLILLSVMSATGWLLIAAVPQSLFCLYAGRLITGTGIGMASSTSSVYVSEVTSLALRTTLLNFSAIMMATGTVIIYIWALFYQNSWVEVSYFAFGLTMVSVVLTPLLPESPMWLLSKGRAEEALQALLRLRGASDAEQVREELESFSNKAVNKQQPSSWLSSLHKLRQPQAYKPLLIMIVFFFFQQLAGATLVIVFAVDFVRDAGVVVGAYHIALAIGCARLIGSLVAISVYSQWGNIGPAVSSGTVMSASMMGLALSVSPFLTLPPWLVATLSVLYVVASSVGFCSLPLALNGEIYPTEVRGVCSGITMFVAFSFTFMMVKLYPGMVLAVGAFPVFLLFAMSGIFGTIFILIFLPDTHGKTLHQIEEYFKGTSKTTEQV